MAIEKVCGTCKHWAFPSGTCKRAESENGQALDGSSLAAALDYEEYYPARLKTSREFGCNQWEQSGMFNPDEKDLLGKGDCFVAVSVTTDEVELITDLYWFEENGVKDFGGDGHTDRYEIYRVKRVIE